MKSAQVRQVDIIDTTESLSLTGTRTAHRGNPQRDSHDYILEAELHISKRSIKDGEEQS